MTKPLAAQVEEAFVELLSPGELFRLWAEDRGIRDGEDRS